MHLISAGTTGFRHMMDECGSRARLRGYTYSGSQLTPGSDLTPVAGVPPSKFKPGLIRRQSKDLHEGTLFGWVDADAVLVGDLDLLQQLEFDIAVTLREPEEVGASGRDDTDDINAGVVFFRQNHRTQALLHAWEFATRFHSGDQHALSAILRKLSGFQAAKGFVDYYDKLLPIDGLNVLVLRALEWNCWYLDRPEAKTARILHFKSGLRALQPASWWIGELQRLAA